MKDKYGIFDSHAHYTDEQFDSDREELLGALPSQGIAYVMNVASDLDNARTALKTARSYGYMYCSAGIHPHEAKDAPEDLEEQIAALLENGGEKVRAVGEIGLDYHYDFSPRDKQKEIFERQLRLAGELDMPVIIHDREAHEDTLELLRKYRPQGVVHCYSGSAQMAAELVGLGLYIGFTGVVTFKNARRALESAAAVPLDRILIETDCPYMAPEPYRGKRCDSTMLPRTAQAVAGAKGIEVEEVVRATCANACRLYRIGR